MHPPPSELEPFRRSEGRPMALASQSIITISSSVHAGLVVCFVQRNELVWFKKSSYTVKKIIKRKVVEYFIMIKLKTF